MRGDSLEDALGETEGDMLGAAGGDGANLCTAPGPVAVEREQTGHRPGQLVLRGRGVRCEPHERRVFEAQVVRTTPSEPSSFPTTTTTTTTSARIGIPQSHTRSRPRGRARRRLPCRRLRRLPTVASTTRWTDGLRCLCRQMLHLFLCQEVPTCSRMLPWPRRSAAAHAAARRLSNVCPRPAK